MKYFVCYEYSERGILSQANKGWSIAEVVKSETGSRDGIPEIYYTQIETHYVYLVEATGTEHAIEVAESRHQGDDFGKGLVWW